MSKGEHSLGNTSSGGGGRTNDGGRTIENDDISDGCLDFLGLKDQAGVQVGTITADHDGYGLGKGW